MLHNPHRVFSFPPKYIAVSVSFIIATFPLPTLAQKIQATETVVIEGQKDKADGLHLKQSATTGSRLGLTPMQTPANIEVISGQTIQNRGDLTVREAVIRATGITSNAAPGNGSTSLASRGFAGHASVMQLFDGTRLFVVAGTTTYPFDTWSIDRIEVLHGAASVLYGEGAIGGVVNVVPKKPEQKSIENEARLTVGINDTYRAAFACGGAINDRWSYQTSIHTGKTGGWMDKGEAKSDYIALAGALRFDATPDLNMTLAYEFAKQHPSVYMGTPLINGEIKKSMRKKSYQVEDADIDYKDQWIKFNTEWTPTDKITLRNQLYYITSKRTWKSAEKYTWNATTGLVEVGDFLHITHDLKQIGNRFDFSYNGSLFGHSNKAVVGFDVNRIDFDPASNSPYTTSGLHALDPNNPQSHQFDTLDPTKPSYSSNTRQFAVFAEDRFNITPEWSVIGGLRFDYYDLHRDNVRTPATSWSRNFSKTTGRIGTVYEFSPNLSIYGQYATAADPMSAMASPGENDRKFGLTKAKQYEVGIKQLFWDQKIEWSLAAYHIKKKNLVSYDETTKTSLPIGAQSSKGIEFAIGAQILPSLRIDANAAILKARYDEFNQGGISYNGNVPTSTPQRAANIWASWEFLPDWTIRPGLRYVGEKYSTAANTTKLPSFTVFDAALEWKMNNNLSWTLHGYNLTDKVYPESGTGGRQWLVGRPRSVELAGHIRF